MPTGLGSARIFSTPARAAIPALSYAPFGEGYAGGQNWIQFTGAGNAWTENDGKNDTGSLEDFMFRRYSPTQGRWISPDPAGLGAVNPSNPQSWNRYAYVLNNPTNAIDPSGLACNFLNTGDCGDNQAMNNHLDCIMDGVDTPCNLVYATIQAGGVLQGNFGSYLGSNGKTYQYVAGVNGPVWIGPNGEELDNPPIELGLGSTSYFPDYSLGAANNCQPPFLCSNPTNMPVVQKPPQPKPQKVTAGCMTARVIQNFGGSDDRAGVTLTLNIAAGIALRKLGTKAAASLLPGPGWVYVGAATLWDLGQVGEAYFYCKNGAPQGGNPEAGDD